MQMADYDLDRLLIQVRRIEEHREKGAEKEIRKACQELLKELRHYLADTYTQYAEDDALSYSILQRHGAYARFLEEVEQKINDISPEVKRLIRSTVDQTYENTYNGMIDCVKKAGIDPVATAGLKACTPDIIRRAVENPVSKLTLNDRLEKHRKEIVYNIKQDISVGLMNGDRYSTMANRIKRSVDGDYKKAVRIARTETHRVREAGNHDAAVSVNDALKGSTAGIRMTKTWRTMKDERVRPVKAKGKNRKYDHRKMEGVTIPVDEAFTLPSGAKTLAPGQSGVAGEDINCRCYLSYGLQKSDERNIVKEIQIPDSAKAIPGMNDEVMDSIQAGIDTAHREYDIRLKRVLVEDASKEYPDTPYMCRYINNNGKHEAVLVLNSGFDFTYIDYMVKEAYRQGYFAGRTLEDHIMHEMAHVMTGQQCGTAGEFRKFLKDVEKKFVPGVSGYSDEKQDGFETIAEAFVRMRNGEEVPEDAKKLVEEYVLRWKR